MNRQQNIKVLVNVREQPRQRIDLDRKVAQLIGWAHSRDRPTWHYFGAFYNCVYAGILNNSLVDSEFCIF